MEVFTASKINMDPPIHAILTIFQHCTASLGEMESCITQMLRVCSDPRSGFGSATHHWEAAMQRFKYAAFYEFLGFIAQTVPRPVTIPRGLFHPNSIPPRFFTQEGPYSGHAARVGCLMQLLFLPEPTVYFRNLCTLFSCSDDVSTFFRVQCVRPPPSPQVSQAVVSTFGCVDDWIELVVALELHRCYNVGGSLISCLQKVEVFTASKINMDPPIHAIMTVLDQSTTFFRDQGKCFAELIRISKNQSQAQRFAMWRMVDGRHRAVEQFWDGARCSLEMMQRDKTVGAFISHGDLLAPNPNSTLLRVGLRVCPMTVELITKTFSRLASAGENQCAFSEFLTTIQSVLDGEAPYVVKRTLTCWEKSDPSLDYGAQNANAQRLLQFSLAHNWSWGLTKAVTRHQYRLRCIPRMTVGQLFSNVCLGAPELRKLREHANFQATVVEWAVKAAASCSHSSYLFSDLEVLGANDDGDFLLRAFFRRWLPSQALRKLQSIIGDSSLMQSAPPTVLSVFLDELFAQSSAERVLTSNICNAFAALTSSGCVPPARLAHYHINRKTNDIVKRVRRACADPSNETLSAMLDYSSLFGECRQLVAR